MSWDVVMIRTKTNSENILPFKQTEIASVIRKISEEPGLIYNCDDLSWQNLDSDSWSIEFNIGKAADTESVMLHIRGGEPKEIFAVLMADLNTRLIDCTTGEFISLDKPKFITLM